MKKILKAGVISAFFSLTVPSVVAQENRNADTFSDVGWTDITTTTAVSTVILGALGYDTDIKLLSVPVTYAYLAKGDVDAFLSNWMPAMEGDIAAYLDAGSVDNVRENFEGAKYTLATNARGAAAGLTHFADIAKLRNELDAKVYGIEPGNDGSWL